MPLVWLNAHTVSLGELHAEESFRMAEIVSIGEGRLKQSAHEKVIRRWNAALGRGDGVLRLRGTAGDAKTLESLGMKVRTNGSR